MSGKQLGKARDQDSYGRNGISWSQHMSRWFSLRTYELEWCVCSDGSLTERERGGGVYIASTQNPTVTHNVPILVGPNQKTRSDRNSKPSDR